MSEVHVTKWSEGDHLIFVGGPPRSGTTLLQNILDSHPSIAGGPEFDHIPSIISLRKLLHSSIETGRTDCYFSKAEVDKEVGRFIENLIFPYATRKGATYVSEKTPMNAECFLELMEVFPNAHFIYCVRDPRAIASSMLEVGLRGSRNDFTTPFFTKNIYAALKVIEKCNKNGFEAANKSNRVYLACYEEIVNNPLRATQKLCTFLGLPWSEAMMSPGDFIHDGQKTMVDGVWYSENMYCNNPDATKSDSWKAKLSQLNRVACNRYFLKKHFHACNYDFDEKHSFKSGLLEMLYSFYCRFKYRKKLKKYNNTRSDWVI